jgi:hypothetical protein
MEFSPYHKVRMIDGVDYFGGVRTFITQNQDKQKGGFAEDR